MRNFLVFVVLLALVYACYNPDKDKKVNNEAVSFATSASSVMFFKNVRQIFYDKSADEATKLDSYRLKTRRTQAGEAVLNLAIVHNWRYDEAYILLEPEGKLQGLDTLQVAWRAPQGGSGAHRFARGDKAAMYRFAVALYGSIQQGHLLQVETPQGSMPLFDRQEDRENFRKTMVDYLRLVNVLR